jgi:hypothetical protein
VQAEVILIRPNQRCHDSPGIIDVDQFDKTGKPRAAQRRASRYDK